MFCRREVRVGLSIANHIYLNRRSSECRAMLAWAMPSRDGGKNEVLRSCLNFYYKNAI